MPAFALFVGVAGLVGLERAPSFVSSAALSAEEPGRELRQREWVMEQGRSQGPWSAEPERPAPPPTIRDFALLSPGLAEELGVPTSSPEVDSVREQARLLSMLPTEPEPLRVIETTVSFFYCEQGSNGPTGDGGGFCGLMRNEVKVHPGAAACAYEYMGQRFRIVGDPTERVYTCEDTGSAVHGEHRDIWFYNSDDGWRWQAKTGRHVTIEILP